MSHKISVLNSAKQDFLYSLSRSRLKLPYVTGYCSVFNAVIVLFSLALSTMTYEVSLRKAMPLRRLMLFVKA